MEDIIKILIKEALSVRKNSYSPYSNYAVGASILADNKKIYVGTNIENASIGGTICAERSAITSACSDGARLIKIIVIVGGKVNCEKDEMDWAFPCGICRQFLNEFSDEETTVVVAKSTEEYKIFKLNELLPSAFGPNNLK